MSNYKLTEFILYALLLFSVSYNMKLNNANFLGNSMVKLDDTLIDDFTDDGKIENMDVPSLLAELKTYMKDAEMVMSKIDKYEKLQDNKSINATVNIETEEVNVTVVENVNVEDKETEKKKKSNVLTFTVHDRTYNISNTIDRAPISEILTILNTEIGLLKENYSNITEINQETNKYIRELRELVTSITNKYNLYNLQKNHKIEIMNKKALEHLHLQLEGALLTIKQKMAEEKEEITDYNLKIEEIIDKLPSEEATCHFLLTCGECVADPTCGWCASTNQCVEGNEQSPFKGQCSFYNFNKCSDKSECEDYKTCDDCMADVGCGWCNGLNNKICIRKTDGEKGLCRSTQFYHIWRTENNECPKINLVNYFDYVNDELEKASHEPIPKPVVRLDIPNINEIIELNEDLIDFYDKKKESEGMMKFYEKEYSNTLENLECIEKEENKTLFENKEEQWNANLEQEGK
jgi:hypothetical protein